MKPNTTNETSLPLPLTDAIVLTTDTHTFTLHPCGPLDATPLIDFTDANFKNDYYFRQGHWRAILADSKYQVFAVSKLECESPCFLTICGIVVQYLHSRLLNLFLAPEYRRSGLGRMILEALTPDEIRAKTDWSDGDPTDFYTKNGYAVVQSREGKNANITILRRVPHQYTSELSPAPVPPKQPSLRSGRPGVGGVPPSALRRQSRSVPYPTIGGAAGRAAGAVPGRSSGVAAAGSPEASAAGEESGPETSEGEAA